MALGYLGASDVMTGQQIVTAVPTPLDVAGVWITTRIILKARRGNTGAVYVGSQANVGPAIGFPLYATQTTGEELECFVGASEVIWIVGTQGDILDWYMELVGI